LPSVIVCLNIIPKCSKGLLRVTWRGMLHSLLLLITLMLDNFYFMCLKVIIIPTRIQGSNFYVITSNIYSWLICLIWMLHFTVYIYWNVDLKAGILLAPSMLHYPMSIKGSGAPVANTNKPLSVDLNFQIL